jgi:phosphatidate phosphatase APP1
MHCHAAKGVEITSTTDQSCMMLPVRGYETACLDVFAFEHKSVLSHTMPGTAVMLTACRGGHTVPSTTHTKGYAVIGKVASCTLKSAQAPVCVLVETP